MKLTYRDKFVVIVVVLILAWAIGFMLVIKPAYAKMKDTDTQLDAKIIELNDKKAQIEADKDLKDRIQKTFDEAKEIANNFYPKMSTDDVSETIDLLLDDDMIINDSMTISDYSSIQLTYYEYNDQAFKTDVDSTVEDDVTALVEEEVIAPVSVTIPNYNVGLGYKCSLDDLTKYLDKLTTNNNKSLIVAGCTVADINADEITGTLSMNLIMFPEYKNPLKETNTDKTEDKAEEAA